MNLFFNLAENMEIISVTRRWSYSAISGCQHFLNHLEEAPLKSSSEALCLVTWKLILFTLWTSKSHSKRLTFVEISNNEKLTRLKFEAESFNYVKFHAWWFTSIHLSRVEEKTRLKNIPLSSDIKTENREKKMPEILMSEINFTVINAILPERII